MRDKGDNFLVDKIDDKGYDYEILMINVRIWIKCKWKVWENVTIKGIVSWRLDYDVG